MALIAHSKLPAFERLRREGVRVLDASEARTLDAPEVHIGLLNLMPDTALEATERQFLRLLASGDPRAPVHVHPFTVPGLRRAGKVAAHVAAHYEPFASLRQRGLDALLVTGANPAQPDITAEDFWPGMIETIEWGRGHVRSILCSCLATHAVLKHYHGVERIKLPQKRWGVYSHHVVERDHPLLAGVDHRFDAPHSHVYEVTRSQVEEAGARVLVESVEAGLHLAVSEDGLRFVFFQGHPEYDSNSLLKEFKREVGRFLEGRREYPPFPANYLDESAREVLRDYGERVREAAAGRRVAPELPEERLEALLANTWSETGKVLFGNWLRLVVEAADAAPARAARVSRSARAARGGGRDVARGPDLT
jgi:homoserine O-succinyltransferase